MRMSSPAQYRAPHPASLTVSTGKVQAHTARRTTTGKVLKAALVLLLAPGVLGCGAARPGVDMEGPRAYGTVIPPADEGEQRVLEMLDDMPVDAPTTVAGKEVTAGERYEAASGKTCRSVAIEGEANSRLACRDMEGWAFVPPVLVTSS